MLIKYFKKVQERSALTTGVSLHFIEIFLKKTNLSKMAILFQHPLIKKSKLPNFDKGLLRYIYNVFATNKKFPTLRVKYL